MTEHTNLLLKLEYKRGFASGLQQGYTDALKTVKDSLGINNLELPPNVQRNQELAEEAKETSKNTADE